MTNSLACPTELVCLGGRREQRNATSPFELQRQAPGRVPTNAQRAVLRGSGRDENAHLRIVTIKFLHRRAQRAPDLLQTLINSKRLAKL